MSNNPPPPIVRISEDEMRRIFNEERYYERTLEGELTAIVKAVRPASVIEPDRIPAGSISQEVRYYDENNNEVARVHQYIKPDGTIGAWGRPDPKRLLHNGTLYRLDKRPNEEPQGEQ